MATFEVTSPDGSKYQVTAPDDASQSDIMAYVRSQAKAPVNSAAAATSPVDAAFATGGAYLDRLAAGLRNKVGAIAGSGVVGAVDKLGQSLGMAPSSDLEQRQTTNAPAMAALQEAHPVASFVGAVPLAAAAKTPLGMAGMAALEYGTPEESALRAGSAYLGGKAGQYLATGLGRLVNPVRAVNPGAIDETQALASKYGVDLRPAQATGSKALAGLEGTLAQLPGSAGVLQKVQQGQASAFDRAAMGALGESGNIGNDAATLARQNIGGRIQAAAAGTSIPVDDALLSDLAKVEANYSKNLSPDQRPIVRQYMDDILNQAPTFTGEAYQAWRSRIGARAAGTSDSELKGALKGIQGALDSAFDRSAGPEASAAMATARGQYRNFKTLEPLIEKASMTSNNIPPMQVMGRALSTGNTQGLMGGLAQLGQTIGREYPNSGTAPRLFWQNVLTNPARLLSPDYLVAATGMPWLTAKTLTSSPVEKYLTNGLMGMKITPEIERRLIRAGVASGGLLGLTASQ